MGHATPINSVYSQVNVDEHEVQVSVMKTTNK